MNGILVVNKPAGYTSHDIVSKIRKELNMKKVGHTGTLDPLATGVLPILLGNGTKLSKYLINHDKEYIATIKLGEKTDTGDIEGKVIERKELVSFSEKQLLQVLEGFKGKQKQFPPMYSAIKINGKKLYEYARNGESVEVQPREIEIYGIELLSFNSREITIKIACSKGTYIRTLCEDISEKLDNLGTMLALQRTKVGEFEIEKAITLEELQNVSIVQNYLITPEKLFMDKPEIELNNNELKNFLNGVKLKNLNENGLYRIYAEHRFIGIGEISNNMLKREYVLDT